MCMHLSLCIQKARGGAMLDGIVKVAKMLNSRPHSWKDCVTLARVKFEKYFNHRVGVPSVVTTWLNAAHQ